MKKLGFSLFSLMAIINSISYSQQINVDSLRIVWNDPNMNDTDRIKANYYLAKIYTIIILIQL